jgi:hypothetical protein
MFYSPCNLGYVLRVEIGEEIQDTLRQFAQKVNLKGAFYQGIGVISQVELAFFCSEAKEYERRHFHGDYEMISLMGNISASNGFPSPHSHVTLGDRNFQTISGHLVRGVVSVTAEILVVSIELSLTRKEDPLLKYKGLISPNRTHLKIDT